MGLCLIIISVSILISYGGFFGYSILPADVVFSWASVATKLLVLWGLTLTGIVKRSLNSSIAEIIFSAIFVILAFIYYAIIVHINTQQARRKKIKFPVKALLINLRA